MFAATALLAVGCSKSKPAGPPPAKPATGAPVVFQVTKVTPGESHNGAIGVNAYNFSDKAVAGYSIKMRYADQAGARIKVKPGTPFEADFDFWSMQGPRMKCEPKSWCTFDITHLDVPATAVNADVIASEVRSIGADGATFDPEPLWKLDGDFTKWPDSMK